MSNHSHLLSFNIESWNACALGLTETTQWEAWAKTLDWPSEGKVDASSIPPMMRRRMSIQSKLAVQTALNELNNQDIDYLVFSSRHGELHRTVTIIEDILSGEEASPMAFAQSVHNTAAGLTTIASKKPIPVTSIAAGENTFHSALLDAFIFLHENPKSKVLLIDFDQPLPHIYQEFEEQRFSDYAVGCVLTSGHQFTVQRKTTSSSTSLAMSSLPQGLQCFQHFLLHSNSWEINSQKQQWLWSRNP